VVGAALARRAALELEKGAGITSTSLAALLNELARRPLAPQSVLVIDEAGMVPTRMLAEVIEHVEHVERAEGKLVLVGDERQLPEIGAGGAFRAKRLPAVELRENRRQHALWEREALALLRGGDAEEAVHRYEERGRIVTGDDAGAVQGRLVADWWAAADVDQAVMIAHRRRDVADLNGRTHALMRASGALGDEEVAGIAVGDRVLIRRNDRRLGVVNGERGVVAEVDAHQRAIAVQLAQRTVTLDRTFLAGGDGAVSLGYAITGHAAQGLTCSRTFVLASDELSREWAYVALSRGRDENRLHVVRGEAAERLEFAPRSRAMTPAELLMTGLGRSSAQRLASDGERAAHVVGLLAVTDELAAAELRLEEARNAEQAIRQKPRKRRYRRRDRARYNVGRGESALVTNRATERVGELRLERARLRDEASRAARAPERTDKVLEQRRAAGRQRDFGIER
jgi:ATP-dependent exoDNAse (exonuclease V) alpha subunit